MPQFPTLEQVQTPALVLDRQKLAANAARLRSHVEGLGASFRPHLKTVKSVEAARVLQPETRGPVAVSTLREAEEFALAGVVDIIYAVGIAPDKLERVAELRRQDVDLAIILDSPEQVSAVLAAQERFGSQFAVLLEVDADAVRAGLKPADPLLVELGSRLSEGGALLRGVLTHHGGSYAGRDQDALAAFAEEERLAAVTAATALRSAGLPCPVVSVGSTPTATAARSLAGVTEVRAGVFATGDLVMTEVGAVRREDIALSVLATVTGAQRERGRIFTNAGWTALSPDPGTRSNGYGLITDLSGRPIPWLVVSQVSQEHGVLTLHSEAPAGTELPELPYGSRVRIHTNHACATTAMHDQYLVVDGDSTEIHALWPIFRGW